MDFGFILMSVITAMSAIFCFFFFLDMMTSQKKLESSEEKVKALEAEKMALESEKESLSVKYAESTALAQEAENKVESLQSELKRKEEDYQNMTEHRNKFSKLMRRNVEEHRDTLLKNQQMIQEKGVATNKIRGLEKKLAELELLADEQKEEILFGLEEKLKGQRFILKTYKDLVKDRDFMKKQAFMQLQAGYTKSEVARKMQTSVATVGRLYEECLEDLSDQELARDYVRGYFENEDFFE